MCSKRNEEDGRRGENKRGRGWRSTEQNNELEGSRAEEMIAANLDTENDSDGGYCKFFDEKTKNMEHMVTQVMVTRFG